MPEKYRILVVDDLRDWRLTLRGLLADEGYEVEVAGSLPEALTFLESRSFDLALLDLRLDETDEDNTEGLTLADKIKKSWPGVKVIIITGYGTPKIMREALEPNVEGQSLVADYVPKAETEDLVRIVRQTLPQ
jgi:two-component system nitrogen regulation response regulator NtrX